MMVEIRHLATVDEIEAVELHCKNPDCSGVVRLDLLPGCLDNEQRCPRCKSIWWHSSQTMGENPLYGLLFQFMKYRAIPKDQLPGPTITIVLPGEPDRKT